MEIRIELKGDEFVSKAQVETEVVAAKADSLVQAQRLLKEQQAAGEFPTDPNDYVLYLNNRGQESRRDFGTIQARYLRLPYSLSWVQTGGGTEVVREAAIYALQLLRERAPVRWGTTRGGAYLASTSIYVDRKHVSLEAFRRIEIRPETRIAIAPDVAYSSTIEKGFFDGYYKTENARQLRGGIVRPIADEVRARFGRDVACRFSYQRIGRQRAGTQPVIEIAVGGAFVQNDARPGAPKRRRSKRVRR